jgi:DNA-binding MarR family transcriptional regulator
MQSPAADRIAYLVKQVQRQFRQATDAALRPLGLSTAQYSVLFAVSAQPGISAAELARQSFVTRQSLQDVLAGLRRSGLVEVAPTGTGRRRDITLTDGARDLLAVAEGAVREVEHRMLAGVDQAEVACAAAVLRRCRDNLTTSR